MFDVGFSEMIVIGIVALVVIGPERLPKVARTLGVLTGRLQRYVSQVKSDISREMELAELGKVKNEFESAARSFQSDIESKAAETEREIREAQSAIERDLEAKSAADGPSSQAEASPAVDAPAPSPQLELGIEPIEPAPPERPRPPAPTP
jgi:sec-independent protein translocase protein TatB